MEAIRNGRTTTAVSMRENGELFFAGAGLPGAGFPGGGFCFLSKWCGGWSLCLVFGLRSLDLGLIFYGLQLTSIHRSVDPFVGNLRLLRADEHVESLATKFQ